MHRDLRLYLEDILLSANKIQKHTRKLSYKQFIKNELVVDAILRNLMVIGEAVKNIPDDVKKRYPSIEWWKIIGLRDILIHAYSQVTLTVIWDVIKTKIPELKKTIRKMMRELD